MFKMTQGTVICGVRSEKYAEINCYAVVINARCDLAQCKTNKIYYLIALPFDQWIFTPVGFSAIIDNSINDLSNSIKSLISTQELSWEELSTFSVNNFEKVIEDTTLKIKEKKQLILKFKRYIHLKSNELTIDEKKQIIRDEKKQINHYFSEMSNGKNSKYLLIPENALTGKTLKDDIIIDLGELDYFNMKEANALQNGDIDNKNIRLTEANKKILNDKFFIYDEPGFSMIIDETDSPWIEYIVQHFANAFTRVGVNNMSKEQIETTINIIIEE